MRLLIFGNDRTRLGFMIARDLIEEYFSGDSLSDFGLWGHCNRTHGILSNLGNPLLILVGIFNGFCHSVILSFSSFSVAWAKGPFTWGLTNCMYSSVSNTKFCTKTDGLQ